MLEVGWSEILVIALILIIVVGPKDLPGMLRNFGRVATRVRGMANEFKGQFDQALREADLDDVRNSIGEVSKLNPTNALRDAMNPIRQFGQDLKTDLQKATDIKPDDNKPADSTKVDQLAADPSVTPVAASQVAATAPAAAIPAAAMPILNTSVVETPKPVRKKAERPVVVAAESEPVLVKAASRKVAKSAPDVAQASADVFPPAIKKAPVRKSAVKASDHAVKVVSTEEPAKASKPAARKKTAKSGDA